MKRASFWSVHLMFGSARLTVCDFYMAKDQFEFWKHTELTIDSSEGRGASFSLEIPIGLRFVTKSRVFSFEESQNLVETRFGDMI